jgi:hypothetical protein
MTHSIPARDDFTLYRFLTSCSKRTRGLHSKFSTFLLRPFFGHLFLTMPRKPSRCFTPADFQSFFDPVAELIGHSISDHNRSDKAKKQAEVEDRRSSSPGNQAYVIPDDVKLPTAIYERIVLELLQRTLSAVQKRDSHAIISSKWNRWR